jgi:RNA-binding protein
MNPLTPADRRALRAKAHHLEPVVIVGQHGLTPPVLREVDLALKKHELIKVRVFSDARAERMELQDKICAAMDCAAVQHLGKVLVLWRPSPEAAKAPPAPRAKEPVRARKTSTQRFHAPKTGPRAALDPVRERRRGTHAETASGGKGTRGAARFDAPGDAADRPARRPQGTRAAFNAASGANRARGGDLVPPRAKSPTGAAGMSRQKIRARGAAGTTGAAASRPPRGGAEATGEKRKSTYTPKTTPRSFSAKPNPREAWAKRPPAGGAKPASGTPRRRRKA